MYLIPDRARRLPAPAEGGALVIVSIVLLFLVMRRFSREGPHLTGIVS